MFTVLIYQQQMMINWTSIVRLWHIDPLYQIMQSTGPLVIRQFQQHLSIKQANHYSINDITTLCYAWLTKLFLQLANLDK